MTVARRTSTASNAARITTAPSTQAPRDGAERERPNLAARFRRIGLVRGHRHLPIAAEPHDTCGRAMAVTDRRTRDR
jgi:hypothetical protein